jgi:hypothetical protein
MLIDFSILQIASATSWTGQHGWKQQYALFMEFQFIRTMDQVLRLDLGLYFHSAVLVTTSWLLIGGSLGLLSVSSVSTFAYDTFARLSSSPNSRL